MRVLVTNIGRRIYFGNFLVDLKKKIKNFKIYLADNNSNISGLKIKGTQNVKLPKVETVEYSHFINTRAFELSLTGVLL